MVVKITSIKRPSILDSEYVYVDETGYKIKENAPIKVKEEFERFMRLVNKDS